MTRNRNYPMDGWSYAQRAAKFREQMADFARGERLRELRDGRHLSQEDAAHEIGVSVKSLRSWEKGGGIRWDNAKSAGAFYGVDPESLVSRELVEGGPTVELLEGLQTLDEKIDSLRVELLAAVGEVRSDTEALLQRRELGEHGQAANGS